MLEKRNIVLVGFMGTGKTSVGKALAKALGMEFLDMDHIIEQREKRPIPLIFSENGETYFRSLERALVQELASRSGLVIATGGGIVLNSDNIRDFSATGTVICLWAEPETILARVGKETHRPLLAGSDKMQKIRSLLESRRSLYESIPARVDTTDLTVEEVIARVLRICHCTR